MKKKSILIVGIIVILILLFNIITLAKGTNQIYNYAKARYFPDILNLDEQYGLKEYKTEEQKIVVDDYTLTMDQYYFSEDRTKGYLRIKVTNPNYDMRDLERDETISSSLSFGDHTRFLFGYDSEGESMAEGITAATFGERYKTIPTKDALYIYYRFYSDDGILFSGKVYLYDRANIRLPEYSDYIGKKKYSSGMFDIAK